MTERQGEVEAATGAIVVFAVVNFVSGYQLLFVLDD